MSVSALPITLAEVHGLHQKVRTERPLVHSITNYVAMTIAANVLLAAGASPAMLHAAEEVEDFADIARALLINIGTPSPAWVTAMRLAARRYRDLGKPWVLDPVAVGATPLRDRTTAGLVALGPAVIRGNASEIMALAGVTGVETKGVDSTESAEAAIAGARSLARAAKTVVAVTGEVDYVTDGRRTVAIESGHPLMPLSTALGCALSGLVAAFTAVAPPFEAAVAALATYAAAGRIAGGRVRGPGHLPQELCDALFLIDLADLEANAHLESVER